MLTFYSVYNRCAMKATIVGECLTYSYNTFHIHTLHNKLQICIEIRQKRVEIQGKYRNDTADYDRCSTLTYYDFNWPYIC